METIIKIEPKLEKEDDRMAFQPFVSELNTKHLYHNNGKEYAQFSQNKSSVEQWNLYDLIKTEVIIKEELEDACSPPDMQNYDLEEHICNYVTTACRKTEAQIEFSNLNNITMIEHSYALNKSSANPVVRIHTYGREKSRGNSVVLYHSYARKEPPVNLFNIPVGVDGTRVSNGVHSHLQNDRHSTSLQCTIADYGSDKKSLPTSRTKTHIIPFACDICKSKFCSCSLRDKVELEEHHVTHAAVKQFACDHCSVVTTSERLFIQHFKIHSNIKPFKCPLCSYQTIFKLKLKAHLSIHVEKSFVCGHCNFRATTKRNLSYHIQIHAGVKPFKCGLCSYRSFRKSHLKTHILNHTTVKPKPFICELCSYSVLYKKSLIKHLSTHAGLKSQLRFQKHHLI